MTSQSKAADKFSQVGHSDGGRSFFRYKQDEFSVSFPPVGKSYTDLENIDDVDSIYDKHYSETNHGNLIEVAP